jgi:hypothetical protein
MRVISQPKMNINGKMYSTKEGYGKSREFSIDVFEKKTDSQIIKSGFTSNSYKSIAVDAPLEKLYCLGNGNRIDTYDYAGNFLQTKNIDRSDYAPASTVTDVLNINPMSLIDGDTSTYWQSDASTAQHTATISLGSTKTLSYFEVYVKSGRSAVIGVQFNGPNGTTSASKTITTGMSGVVAIPITPKECHTIILTVTHSDAFRDLISQVYYGYNTVGTPISITQIGMGEFAVLHSYVSSSSMQEIVIYDENMIENRKYIYNGIPELIKITWNLDQYIVALALDTTFFEMSKNNGSWNFRGNPPNAGYYNIANDIFFITKLNSKFLGVLFNDKIEFIDYMTMEKVDLAKPPTIFNAIVYDDMSKEYLGISDKTLKSININSSRLDLITLKKL